MSDLLSIHIVPRKSPVFQPVLTTVLWVLLSACASQKPPAARLPEPVETLPPVSEIGDALDIEASLREAYARWQGTRHKMGGIDQSGVDCSGFVKAVYRNIFQVHLPRTTAEQLKAGAPVGRYALKPGDLVFFRPPGYPRHVGIYLAQDRFLHASKSKGVTISTIDADYWGPCFWTARRVLRATR